MVPHFGSNVKQNTDVENDRGILDRYTGADERIKITKKEVPYMFKPEQENIFGQQSVQDKSRFYQSSSKNGLLPVPQIKEQPIPIIDTRPTLKNQDQLNVNPRRNNKPVQPVKGALPSQGQRGSIGQYVKNRPETAFKWGADRLFTGSTVKGQEMSQNFRNGCDDIMETQLPFNPAKAPVTRGQVGVRRENAGDAYGGIEGFSNLATVVQNDNRNSEYTYDLLNAKSYVGRTNEVERANWNVNEVQRDTTNRMTFQPGGNSGHGHRINETNDLKVTNKQVNLFSYTGNSISATKKPLDYTGDYNYTRENDKVVTEDYMGGVSHSRSGNYDTVAYENMEIAANKENTANRKGYDTMFKLGPKEAIGGCNVNIAQKDDTIKTNRLNGFSNVVKSNYGKPTGQDTFGDFDTNVSKEGMEKDISHRIDPIFMESLKSNPYMVTM